MGGHSPEPPSSRQLHYNGSGSPVSEMHSLAKTKRKTERKMEQENLIKELEGNSMQVQEVMMKLHKHDEYKRSFTEPEANQPYKALDRGDNKAVQYTEIYLDME